MDIYERIKHYEQTQRAALALWTHASNRLALWLEGGEDIRQTEEYKQYLNAARDLYVIRERLAELRGDPWQR